MTIPANGNEGKDDCRPVETTRAGRRSPKDGKLLFIALRSGRLANRLVLFANFIALAAEQGHRLVNFAFHSYAACFETTRRDIFCRFPVAERRNWIDLVPGVAGAIRKTRIGYRAVRAISVLNEFFPVLGRRAVTLRERPGEGVVLLDGPAFQARIRDARIVFVYGWNFRAPGLVQRHAETIRAYFRPIAECEEPGRQAVARLRQDGDVVVGVHVRHGDYRQWKRGRYFFPVSRYSTWMQALAEQFPNRRVSFLVCSNEPRHRQEFPGLTVGFGAGSPVTDLYALARCDYIIGPVSSFSQWASFYGNKPLLHLNDLNVPVERERFRISDLGEIPG